jgi:hypothetical protein
MLKDPTAWMDDLEFYLDDENIVQTAAAIEPTLLYGGSKTAAGAWIGFVGVLGGAFGAMTLSSEIRTPAVFVGFLVVAALLLRGLHPLSVRLLGSAVAWLAMLAFFWTALLGFFAILGARIQSTLFAYVGPSLFERHADSPRASGQRPSQDPTFENDSDARA